MGSDEQPRPVVVHPLALELLTRVAWIAMDRMNSASDIAPWEAHTLGRITAVATGYPGVFAALEELERRRHQQARAIVGPALPPLVVGRRR